MSEFSKLEQAERWVNRLEAQACELIESGDYDQADDLKEQAMELNRVISKVQYGCADADDLKLFNAAVESRTQRDIVISW